MRRVAISLVAVGALAVVAGIVLLSAPGPGFVLLAVGVPLLPVGMVLVVVSRTQRAPTAAGGRSGGRVPLDAAVAAVRSDRDARG